MKPAIEVMHREYPRDFLLDRVIEREQDESAFDSLPMEAFYYDTKLRHHVIEYKEGILICDF